MAVGEDDREELTISLAILVLKLATVEPHDTRIRLVEPGDQLDKRRLAAAVPPCKNDQLPRPERQIDGAQREAWVIMPVAIGESDTLQSDRITQREPPWRKSPLVRFVSASFERRESGPGLC